MYEIYKTSFVQFIVRPKDPGDKGKGENNLDKKQNSVFKVIFWSCSKIVWTISDLLLYVIEIQIQIGFRNVTDIVDLQVYWESKLAKIIARRENESV